jgi:hypothetical protein
MHFFSPGPFGENLAFRYRRQSVLSELPTVSSSGRDPES